MYNDPKLTTPVLAATLSAFCLWVAWKTKFPDWLVWLQALLVIVGAALALVAFVTGADYILTKFEAHLRAVRSSWYAPLIRITDNIKAMSPAQLAYIQEVIPFKMTGKFAGDEISWWISAPRGDIPLSFLSEYLEKCEAEGWETLIPQHGMADNMEREYMARIHELMVFRGFATRPTGNQRGRWLVAPDVVYAKLGLGEA